MVMLKIRYETLIFSGIIVEGQRRDICFFGDLSYAQHALFDLKLFRKINLNIELDSA